MRTLGTVLGAFVVPLMLLNIFGGIVAGIWLVIAGQWGTVFLGLAIAFVGAFIVSILLLPGIGLAGLGFVTFERGYKTLGGLLMLLSSPWTPLVILVWELAMFGIFGHRVPSPTLAIPVWVWSYGAATGVWAFLAHKETQAGDGDGAVFQAFGAQLAYIVFSVCYLLLGWSFPSSVIAMAVPLILPLAFGLTLAAASLRRA